MPILYVLLLLSQIALLIFAICRKSRKWWLLLLIWEIFSAALTWGLGAYYDSLPGYGFMPGLSYFAEAILGYGTAILSLGLAALSAILWMILRKRK